MSNKRKKKNTKENLGFYSSLSPNLHKIEAIKYLFKSIGFSQFSHTNTVTRTVPIPPQMIPILKEPPKTKESDDLIYEAAYAENNLPFSRGTLLSEKEADKLKKEFGDLICVRCRFYGTDIYDISKDKEKNTLKYYQTYVSELVQPIESGPYWCLPHFRQNLKDIAIFRPYDIKTAVGEEKYQQVMEWGLYLTEAGGKEEEEEHAR